MSETFKFRIGVYIFPGRCICWLVKYTSLQLRLFLQEIFIIITQFSTRHSIFIKLKKPSYAFIHLHTSSYPFFSQLHSLYKPIFAFRKLLNTLIYFPLFPFHKLYLHLTSSTFPLFIPLYIPILIYLHLSLFTWLISLWSDLKPCRNLYIIQWIGTNEGFVLNSVVLYLAGTWSRT